MTSRVILMVLIASYHAGMPICFGQSDGEKKSQEDREATLRVVRAWAYYEDGKKLADEALKSPPDQAAALIDSAMVNYDKSIAIKPTVEALLGRASIYMFIKNAPKTAMDDVEYALRVDSENDNVLFLGCLVCRELNDEASLKKLIEFADRALKINPKKHYYHTLKIHANLMLGDIPAAATESKKAIELGETDFYNFFLQGCIESAEGRNQKSLGCFAIAVQKSEKALAYLKDLGLSDQVMQDVKKQAKSPVLFKMNSPSNLVGRVQKEVVYKRPAKRTTITMEDSVVVTHAVSIGNSTTLGGEIRGSVGVLAAELSASVKAEMQIVTQQNYTKSEERKRTVQISGDGSSSKVKVTWIRYYRKGQATFYREGKPFVVPFEIEDDFTLTTEPVD